MSAGDVCFVNYGEVPHTVHVRLLGCHISQNLWAIITPDRDIYEEEMSPGNGDFVDFTYGGGGLAGGIPPGINPAHVYGFGVMSAAEYQQLMAQARIYAAAIRVSMGLPAVPDPPVQGQGRLANAVPSEPEVWVSIENEPPYLAGRSGASRSTAAPWPRGSGHRQGLVTKWDFSCGSEED